MTLSTESQFHHLVEEYSCIMLMLSMVSGTLFSSISPWTLLSKIILLGILNGWKSCICIFLQILTLNVLYVHVDYAESSNFSVVGGEVDIVPNVWKDYSHNKEALKVDYLVGLPSLTSRGGQVPEHGHGQRSHGAGVGARHFRHTVITAFKIRIEKLMIRVIIHCDVRVGPFILPLCFRRNKSFFLIFCWPDSSFLF